MYVNMYEYSWEAVRESINAKLAEADQRRLVREAMKANRNRRTSFYHRLVSRFSGAPQSVAADEASGTESVAGKPSFA